MPRVRTVAALEDVKYCSFCGAGLTPAAATSYEVQWPPAVPLGRRYTAGRWFACNDCQNEVTTALNDMQSVIRTRRERAWRERQQLREREQRRNLNVALDDIRASRSARGLEP